MAEFKFIFSLNVMRNQVKLRKIGCRWKSFNSTEWLKRREKDIYTERAKIENYRCRSAFKLIEIDDKYKLVKPGFCVVDVGAAPGSWSQVLAKRTNSNGRDQSSPVGTVIAIDLSYMYSIDGVKTLFNMDFTSSSAQEKIIEILGSRKLDFVFSDIAPRASGVKSLDQQNILKLLYAVVIFSTKNLKPGGGCLIKVWEGQHVKLVEEMKRLELKYLHSDLKSCSFSIRSDKMKCHYRKKDLKLTLQSKINDRKKWRKNPSPVDYS